MYCVCTGNRRINRIKKLFLFPSKTQSRDLADKTDAQIFFTIPDPNGVITKIKILSSFIHLDVVSHGKVWNGMRVSKWWQKLFPVWRLILHQIWSLFILRSVASALVMCSYSWCVDGWDYERWSRGVRALCLCPSALAAICVN